MVKLATGSAGVDTIIVGSSSMVVVPLKIITYADCTACGWDPFTRTSKKVDCRVCGGEGRLRTESLAYISAYARWTTQVGLSLNGIVMTGEMGDCAVTTAVNNKALLDRAVNAEESWFVIDGQRVKPVSVQVMHSMDRATTITAVCKIVRTGGA